MADIVSTGEGTMSDYTLGPSQFARDLLATAFERHDFPTMPWTIRNAAPEHLSQSLAAYLEAIDWLIASISNVDYFEGNGADLLEHAVRRATSGENGQ